MTARSKRRRFDAFNLSFLDVISCGFGAIVLLLLITKVAGPSDGSPSAQDAAIQELFEQMEAAEETQIRADSLRQMVADLSQKSAQKEREIETLQTASQKAQDKLQLALRLVQKLDLAQQTLTEEMKRLLKTQVRDLEVGGIPVDSEYIVFIIDTSGSMKTIWPRVMREVENVIKIHPTVRGIQFMNDNGNYLFESYAGKFMPDVPSIRKRALKRLQNWAAFSNSSPVEGITAAIKGLYSQDKRISLYVFGDEFTGDSVGAVLRSVEGLNKVDRRGRRKVRIHAVGFFSDYSTGRFATLMSQLSYRNGGTFIALPK